MSQHEKESLSALLDNEADDLELRRLLKSCDESSDKSSELLQTWERYNLTQTLLHDKGVPVGSKLAQSIHDQIELEPAFDQKSPTQTNTSWGQGLSKIAIAASVAMVFVVGFQISLEDNSTPALVQQSTTAPAQQQQIEASLVPAPTLLAESVDFQVDPEAQQRLLEYIESMTFDEEEPVRLEHIQDSPLYRLVNEIQAKP